MCNNEIMKNKGTFLPTKKTFINFIKSEELVTKGLW